MRFCSSLVLKLFHNRNSEKFGEFFLVVHSDHLLEEVDIELPVQEIVAEFFANVGTVKDDFRSEVRHEVADHSLNKFFFLGGIIDFIADLQTFGLEDFTNSFFDPLGGDRAFTGDVISLVFGGEGEEIYDSFLNIVDGHKVNLISDPCLKTQIFLEGAVGSDLGFCTIVALDHCEEFENTVESEGLSDYTVRTASNDDGRTVDGVGETGFTDELFGIELTLFIGVVETGSRHGVFHNASFAESCDISCGDVMESGDICSFRESESCLGAAVVGGIGFSLGVFSEVHICSAVEECIVRTFRQHFIFGECLKGSFDDFHSGKNV